MSTEQMGTYEKIYFALWELGQRYGNFVQFRVIGRSHDDRMIPMLEIGKGDTCIICLSGVESGDRNLPEYLLSIAKDYCRSYESNWTIGESYEVRKLLDKVRIRCRRASRITRCCSFEIFARSFLWPNRLTSDHTASAYTPASIRPCRRSFLNDLPAPRKSRYRWMRNVMPRATRKSATIKTVMVKSKGDPPFAKRR